MSFVKKTIAGAAAIAALVAMPAATAVADDATVPDTAAVQSTTNQHLLTDLSILTDTGYQRIDLDKALNGGFDVWVNDLDAVDYTNLTRSGTAESLAPSAVISADGLTMTVTIWAFGPGQSESYIVRFHKVPSTDTTLTWLNVDNYTVDLDQAQTAGGYVVNVDDLSDISGTVMASSVADGATLLSGGSAGDGVSSKAYFYYVVAEDGTTISPTYTVRFVKTASSDTHLSSLTVDNHIIDLTQAATSDGYTIEVKDPHAVDLDLIGGAWASGADVKLGSTVEGKNHVSATYYVVAEDGTQSGDYKVNFVKAASSSTNLTSLTVDGYVVYDPAQKLTDATTTDGYTIMVDDPSAIDPSVIGGAWSDGAKVVLGGESQAADGSSVSYTYYVVAEDGTQGTVSYKVTFKKASKSSATGLTTLTVDGYVAYDAAKGMTDAATAEGYTITVDDPSAIDPSVIGGAWSAGADVLLGGSTENDDKSQISYFYYVVAEDGTRGEVTYKVNFVKAESGETPTEPEEPGEGDEPTTPSEGAGTTTPSEGGQQADGQTDENEGKPMLGETGSAVLGLGVFAAVALLGGAMFFVMRKRV